MSFPTGSVTFLFTDIEGSGRLWQQHPTAMGKAIARHDELLQDAVVKNRGLVVKMRGDGLHAVFASAQDAIAAAIDGQRALQSEKWDGDIGQVPVRMGLHSGSAELRDGDYFGPSVNRAARLQDAGHGGQILLSQASSNLLGDQLPTGITLRSLGRYQIQDFPTLERVYQVVAPGLRDNFPPLRAPGGRRTNLPASKTSFVGRDRELALLKQMLVEGRLVTLTGPGGTGKTRLALQAAANETDSYRDGVWLVELAPLAEESMVLPAIAKVFSLQPDPQRSLETMLSDFLRDKKLLLLLDNCEHLIEACATVAGDLLDVAPGLKIMASSREALSVPGETVLRVPSLVVPASNDKTAAALRRSEAARLFSERARAVVHDFQITDENASAVAEICQRLDGIPLAIELAAGRMRLFSPQQLASRLNDRFRLLTGGNRTALPRQQTLQALIDWSYELLSSEEQALFRRLAVFVGGWTYEAAEAVSDRLDVLELLDQLVSKSLIQTEQGIAGIRFRYLETIRQYASERLVASGEGETVRDLHFAYFSGLVTDEFMKSEGHYRDEMRIVLKPEIDNFHQALGWAIHRDIVAALDMMVGVVSFIVQESGWGDRYGQISRNDVRGWLAIARESLEARRSEEGQRFRRSQAQRHLLAGQSAMGVGEFDFARQELTQAIALARELDDESMLMAALGFLSTTANAQQRLLDEEAFEVAEECLALARKRGDVFYAGMSLLALAEYATQHGNAAEAQAYLAEAATGGGFMSAMAAFQTGTNLSTTGGDLDRALFYLQESRRQFETLDNTFFVTVSTSQIAHTHRWRGELDAAEASYRESLVAFHWQGHIPAVAHELECLAYIAQRRGAPARAARLLGAAEALREQTGVPMLANEQVEYEAEVATLKQVLDAWELQSEWLAGRAMSIEQAVEYALADLS